MPGSVGNPVHLDPFTDIVEVHWTDNYLKIRLNYTLVESNTDEPGVSCTFDDLPPGEGAFWGTWSTGDGFEWSLEPDTEEPSLINLLTMWKGPTNGWVAFSQEQKDATTFDSFITLPETFTYGSREWVGGGGVFNGNPISGSQFLWDADRISGDSKIPVGPPLDDDIFFLEDTIHGFHMLGDKFLAPLPEYCFGGVKYTAVTAGTPPNGNYDNAEEHDFVNIDIQELEVTIGPIEIPPEDPEKPDDPPRFTKSVTYQGFGGYVEEDVEKPPGTIATANTKNFITVLLKKLPTPPSV